MPLDPVSARAELFPDVFAPAAVVPNIVRGAKMGKWTSSCHVVKEVGSYHGLGSFSLRPNHILDLEKIGNPHAMNCKTKLLFEQRPHVRSTFERHYPDQKKIVDLIMQDKYAIDSKDISKARVGSNFISLQDAFDGWKLQADKDHDGAENISKLSVMVHPVSASDPSNRIGAPPAPQVILRYSPSDHQGLLALAVLQHSSEIVSMIDLAQQTIEDKDDNVLQVLKFVRLAIKVQHSSQLTNISRKKFLQAITQLQSQGELWNNLGIPASSILTITDGSIPDIQVQTHCIIVLQDSHSPIPCSDLPSVHDTYFLQGVYGVDSFRFRWEEGFSFQNVSVRTRQPVPSVNEWQLAVYIKMMQVDPCMRDVKVALSTEGCLTVCQIHGKPLFLVRRLSDHLCCLSNCKRLVSARCLESRCVVGICQRHFQDYECGDDVQQISGSMRPRCDLQRRDDTLCLESEEESDNEQLVHSDVPGDQQQSDIDPGEQDRAHDDNSDSDSDSPVVPLVDSWEDPDAEIVNLAFGSNQPDEGDITNPLYCRTDQMILQGLNDFGMPSHLYLNNALYVLKRRRAGANPARNPVVSRMVSLLGNDPSPLLFPEALLFPRLFWDFIPKVNSVSGALPSFLYPNEPTFPFAQTLMPLSEHLRVRARDLLLPTARTPAYQHFVFDCLVNRYLRGTSSSWLMDRGLGFVPEAKNDSHENDPFTCFDEVTSSRKKKELSFMVRERPWDYFVTLTCSDSTTPGIAEIMAAIKELKPEDRSEQTKLAIELQVLLLSAWNRTIQSFYHYLTNTKESILGPVDSVFMRYEFQGEGCPGNKPHIHAGITLKPEAKEDTLQRVACRLKDLCSTMFGTDFESLKRLNLIDSFEDLLDLNKMTRIQTHDCEAAGSRCMKRLGEDGKKVCRVPVHPSWPEYYFEEIPIRYDNDTLDIFSHLELVHKDELGHWIFHDLLQSGRWHYPSNGVHERFVPTIPLLFSFFRSSTNVQVCICCIIILAMMTKFSNLF